MPRHFFLLLVLALCLATRLTTAADAPILVPAPKDSNEWKTKHEAYVAAARQGGIDLLFVGDSITEFWGAEGKNVWDQHYAPLKAAHFGIAADKVENVLWRLQNGELDIALKPKLLVLLAGINNSWGCKREDFENRGAFIANGIGETVTFIRKKLPDTKILVLAMFPLGDGMAPAVRIANQRIAALADNATVFVLDLGATLSDANGNLAPELTTDGTHLTAKGYQIWADGMAAMLQKILPSK